MPRYRRNDYDPARDIERGTFRDYLRLLRKATFGRWRYKWWLYIRNRCPQCKRKLVPQTKTTPVIITGKGCPLNHVFKR